MPERPSPSAQESMLMQRMRADQTIRHIAALNSEPRTWKTPGYEKGLNYVLHELEAIGGWDVQVEALPIGGFGSSVVRNIVTTRSGTAAEADGGRKLVLAGAHLDSVPRGPGANDNASGSATLIELARSFAGIDTADDIKLVWFDGEEAGLLGSHAYAKKHVDDAPRTIAMVNMDMVASIHGRVGYDLGIRTGQGVSDAIKGVQLRTGLSAVEYAERHTRSDHASFDRWDIPAIDFGVSVRDVTHDDPYYHTPHDTVDKINSDVLEGYGDLIAVTMLDLANRSARP
ncbi:MAG: aminopeptidase [Thermoleophilia bacterium]|nr:aminopeptidase [Thermoleophilia bacterium]